MVLTRFAAASSVPKHLGGLHTGYTVKVKVKVRVDAKL